MSYSGRVVIAIAFVAAMGARGNAQQSQPAGQPAPQPAAPASAAARATEKCPAPAPPATIPARSFSEAVGLLLYQVPTDKVTDFETFLGYLRAALDRSTDPVVQRMAKGWRFLRDTNPNGPNGDVIYVFLLDPPVPCVDYAVGLIIGAAFRDDPAKANEVFKLFQNSIRTPGSLMDLAPAGQSAPANRAPSADSQKPASNPSPATPPAPTPVPLDANPTRPPK